jgi:hypothetical protein
MYVAIYSALTLVSIPAFQYLSTLVRMSLIMNQLINPVTDEAMVILVKDMTIFSFNPAEFPFQHNEQEGEIY